MLRASQRSWSQQVTDRVLTCVAHQHGDVWEATCLDFDIAVQGATLDAVKERLNAAIETYIEDSHAENEPDRSALLARRAPLRARIAWLWPFVRSTLFDRGPHGDSTIGFQIACRA